MTRSAATTALVLHALPAAAAAQHEHTAAARDAVLRVGAHAVPLLTRAAPIARGAAMTEAYLTQPTLLAAFDPFAGAVRVRTTVSLEALTLERGEIGAGTYGEGYIDRRHPHAYVHELIVSFVGDIGAATTSLTIGRGFAPFGTDDPMMRPFVKFPVNHHLAQVLERPLAVAAAGVRGAVIEAGLFAGTEPMTATDWGAYDRLGDSWSARLTLLPLPGTELQLSHAFVTSPEMPRGEGSDQRKWSASVRYERRDDGGALYALAEWNHTSELDDGRKLFDVGGFLLEAALERNGWRPALRLERSTRPEEERSFDRFRSPWPHAHSHVLGITRWTTTAARVEKGMDWRQLAMAPFIEVSHAHVRVTAGGGFDPVAFYGADQIWTFNIGIRMSMGWHASRMGRYGTADGTHTH